MIKLNNIEISQEDLIKEITGNKELMATLKAKFEKKDTGWFVPEKNDIYFYLDVGSVSHSHNSGCNFDEDLFQRQQIFRTEEEAKKADQQRMAKVRILKRIAEENAKDGWVCDWGDINQYKTTFTFNLTTPTKLYVSGSYEFQTKESGFYMSETVVEKLQTELLQDYKIMLGVE